MRFCCPDLRLSVEPGRLLRARARPAACGGVPAGGRHGGRGRGQHLHGDRGSGPGRRAVRSGGSHGSIRLRSIVATGCYATRRPAEVAQLPAVVGPRAQRPPRAGWPARLPGWGLESTANVRGRRPAPFRRDLAAGQPGSHRLPASRADRAATSAAPTASCRTPGARRRAGRSGPSSTRRASAAAARASRSLWLTGVHLGSYGRDLSQPSSLLDLLGPSTATAGNRPGLSLEFARADGLRPAGFSSCGRRRAASCRTSTCRSSTRATGCSRRCVALTRSLASGRLVDGIRCRMPDAAIGTDVIAGFPGETEDDFEQQAAYLARVAADARARLRLFRPARHRCVANGRRRSPVEIRRTRDRAAARDRRQTDAQIRRPVSSAVSARR